MLGLQRLATSSHEMSKQTLRKAGSGRISTHWGGVVPHKGIVVLFDRAATKEVTTVGLVSQRITPQFAILTALILAFQLSLYTVVLLARTYRQRRVVQSDIFGQDKSAV
jgi:hypothetical protein